jgi:hypothetical protein
MYCVVQISCSPVGPDALPSPNTIQILDTFTSQKEALAKWHGDQVYTPKPEQPGQHVYHVLWHTAGPLNLQRHVDNSNTISNMGAWFERASTQQRTQQQRPLSATVSHGAPRRKPGFVTGRVGPNYRPPSAFHQV